MVNEKSKSLLLTVSGGPPPANAPAAVAIARSPPLQRGGELCQPCLLPKDIDDVAQTHPAEWWIGQDLQ
jgi:hypothetical protein